MDIIAQLQEHASAIAYIAFNAAGTIQRDAPSSQLAPDYPKPAGATTTTTTTTAAAADAPEQQPKEMATAFVQAVQRFDALVSALPDIRGGEEAQMKRIAELQAENEAVGLELQRELEAADHEMNQIQELFDVATDNWLQMKPP